MTTMAKRKEEYRLVFFLYSERNELVSPTDLQGEKMTSTKASLGTTRDRDVCYNRPAMRKERGRQDPPPIICRTPVAPCAILKKLCCDGLLCQQCHGLAWVQVDTSWHPARPNRFLSIESWMGHKGSTPSPELRNGAAVPAEKGVKATAAAAALLDLSLPWSRMSLLLLLL